MKPSMRKAIGSYGPVESQNDHVGVLSAETPESLEDNHGTRALRKRKRGGKVEGAKPKHRMDRARHSDEAEDRALIKRMVKPTDLKRPERAAGGKVNSKKGTTVNVIVAGSGAGGPPMGAPMATAMPPAGAAPVPP